MKELKEVKRVERCKTFGKDKMKNKILKYAFFIGVILLLLIGVAIAQIKIKDNISGFNLGKISELYSDIEQGEIDLNDLVFLDGDSQPIKVKRITTELSKGKFYDVDVENDIVLVSRNDGTLVWSGNSNNGTAVGDAYQVDAGYLGKGFEFDGTGDYVDLGEPASLDQNFSQLTISAWFKLSDTGSNAILGKSTIWYLMSTSATNIRIRHVNLGDGYTDVTVPSMSLGQWYHVVAMLNGTDSLLYLDGIYKGGESAIGKTGVNSAGVAIGDYTTSPLYPFNGTIDDVLIFNRSLSADEIKGLYADSSSKYVGAEFTGLSEGSQSFTSYVQDIAGNVNSSTLNFDVDLTFPVIEYVNPSPRDGGAINDTTATINVSASDSANNISVFIDDGSLVGWWRMDDVNQTGAGATVYDKSAHCYDNETKILTDEGLKLFKDLDGSEMVMTLNAETGEKEWQLPMERQVFEYNGKMYRIKTKKGNLTVSPEHKIYVKRLENRRLYFALPLVLFVLLGIGNKKRRGVISDNSTNENKDFKKRGRIR